jgi:hypothetical protein
MQNTNNFQKLDHWGGLIINFKNMKFVDQDNKISKMS